MTIRLSGEARAELSEHAQVLLVAILECCPKEIAEINFVEFPESIHSMRSLPAELHIWYGAHYQRVAKLGESLHELQTKGYIQIIDEVVSPRTGKRYGKLSLLPKATSQEKLSLWTLLRDVFSSGLPLSVLTEAITQWQRYFTFENFSALATIVGFVADVVSLVLLMVSLRTPDNEFVYDVLRSLYTFILFTLTITSFGLAHYYWQERREKEKLADSFWRFLVQDMIIGFRAPGLLIPFALVIALVVASRTAVVWVGISLMIIVAVAMGWWITLKQERIIDEEIESIKSHWPEWEERIRQLLNQSGQVADDSFPEFGYSRRAIRYALRRYVQLYRLAEPIDYHFYELGESSRGWIERKKK
ncbi:MAG: hypothetical protein ACPLF9_08410 [Methanothermobacter tenebrarum]